MISLVSKLVVKALGLRLNPTPPLFMRSVTDEVVLLNFIVTVHFDINGITGRHSVYVHPGSCFYSMLFGRRWLAHMHAIGDYEHETYKIKATDGYVASLRRDADTTVEKFPIHVFRSKKYRREAQPLSDITEEKWEEEEERAVEELVAG